MTGPLQRARLVPEKGTPLDFHYNPSSVTLTKAAHWQSNPARGHQKAPPPEFVGTDPRSVTIVALLDAFDDTKRDVSKVVDQLVEWTCARRTQVACAADRPGTTALRGAPCLNRLPTARARRSSLTESRCATSLLRWSSGSWWTRLSTCPTWLSFVSATRTVTSCNVRACVLGPFSRSVQLPSGTAA